MVGSVPPRAVTKINIRFVIDNDKCQKITEKPIYSYG